MDCRVLEPYEWSRLSESGVDLSLVSPDAAIVLVVEDDDVIVAHAVLFIALHLEEVHVEESRRRDGRALQVLMGGIRGSARAFGATTAISRVESEAMRSFMERIGAAPLEGSHYLVRLRKESA